MCKVDSGGRRAAHLHGQRPKGEGRSGEERARKCRCGGVLGWSLELVSQFFLLPVRMNESVLCGQEKGSVGGECVTVTIRQPQPGNNSVAKGSKANSSTLQISG